MPFVEHVPSQSTKFTGKRALIVDDDRQICRLVGIHLTDLGFEVDTVHDGKQALNLFARGDYGLIVLDLMLPGVDGVELCKRIRAEADSTPILMISARSEEVDKILALEVGADDYLTKPFGVGELLARIKALLRRTQQKTESNTVRVFGDLVIEIDRRKVKLQGQEKQLTALEFELLRFLSANPGRPFTREELLNNVWGYSFDGYDRTVNSHVNRLRSKIEPLPQHPRYVLTVRGVGYQFGGECTGEL